MPRCRGIACAALLGVCASTAWAQDKSPPPVGSYGTYGNNPGPAQYEYYPCRNCDGGIPGFFQFKGWVLAGSAPQDYTVGYETNGLSSAPKINAMIGSKQGAKGAGFGTVMQTISADDYLGQRVRLSALLRPRDVDGGAGLWFRVDGADGKVLAFDNMKSRPILGTQGWKRYDVVIDVPANGKHIAYGVLLIGKGKLGIDELRFDKVGKDVATTDDGNLPNAPVNLELKQ